jgi:hypothetical protein
LIDLPFCRAIWFFSTPWGLAIRMSVFMWVAADLFTPATREQAFASITSAADTMRSALKARTACWSELGPHLKP